MFYTSFHLTSYLFHVYMSDLIGKFRDHICMCKVLKKYILELHLTDFKFLTNVKIIQPKASLLCAV